MAINVRPTLPTYTPAVSLAANRTYYWRVRAFGLFGRSDWSLTGTFITPNPPSVPLLLTPALNALTTDLTPRLDWKDSTAPTGTTFSHYQVQVATDNSFSSPLHDQLVSASEFTVPLDLTPNTRYFWRVRAYNTLGQVSVWSQVRPLREAILPTTLLLPDAGQILTTQRPLFDWEDVAGASGYTIQFSRYVNFSIPLLTVKTTASTYTPLVNLPKGVTLYWRVRVTATNGPSVWSETRSFTIQ